MIGELAASGHLHIGLNAPSVTLEVRTQVLVLGVTGAIQCV